LKYLGACSSVG